MLVVAPEADAKRPRAPESGDDRRHERRRRLRGTKRRDVIVAKGGNDRVSGRKRGDYICGGGGNDSSWATRAATG